MKTKRDLSQVEPSLIDLIFTTYALLKGKLGRDYWVYRVDQERIPIIAWLHRN